MGAKFYRGADKPKKIRKRFSQTRSWFRTLKWVAYHAHPLMIVGHPFKGGYPFSTGYLEHPDMKRFAINDSTLFVPPRPGAWATAMGVGFGVQASQVPSFGDFFATYFAGKSYYVAEGKCSVMLEGMKKCWENNAAKGDPESSCGYYIQGFERLSCGN